MPAFSLAIFDLDGTLYRGGEPIPHAVETVRELRARGVQVRYLTNNSGQTRLFFAQKLTAMGFPCAVTDVWSSGLGAAMALASAGHRRVFIIGEPGLVQTLREADVRAVNAGESDGVTRLEKPAAADAVVVGICRRFSYDLMDSAMQEVRAGAAFYATNTDATYPLEGGRFIPGSGSLVAAVATCTGVQPTVIGKPNPFLVERILEETGVAASDCVLVGDRPETDLECGRRLGCQTHLVLTGVVSEPPSGQAFSPDLRGLLDR